MKHLFVVGRDVNIIRATAVTPLKPDVFSLIHPQSFPGHQQLIFIVISMVHCLYLPSRSR